MIKYNAKIKYQKIINRVKMKLYNMMFLTIDPMVYIYRYIGLNKTFYSNKEFCLDHHSRTYILQYKKKTWSNIYYYKYHYITKQKQQTCRNSRRYSSLSSSEAVAAFSEIRLR